MQAQAKWNERFAKEGYAYGQSANDFLRESAHLLPKGKILSLGEGEGRNAVYLAKLGYDVTAIDYSEIGLDKAHNLAKENRTKIHTIHADLTTYKLEKDYWQGIVSIYFHVHKDERSKIHKKCVDALEIDGVFILESYSTKQLRFGTGGPKNSDLLLDLDEVLRELEGLDFKIARVSEREVIEGDYHTGLGSVVQIVAVKK
jgi:SAM-dependent methyltransferase